MARRGLGYRVTGEASPHDRAMAGSTAMHALYSKGNETSAQIAAQESNLVYANLSRLGSVTNINKIPKGMKVHHGAIKLPKSGHYKSATSRGRAWAKRFQNGASLAGLRPLPRGDRRIAYDALAPLKAKTVTGRFPKFIPEISPVHFDSRGKWGRARTISGFTKVVTPRKKRLVHLKNWSHRGHMWIPR